MNKDRIEGVGKQVKHAITGAAGRVTGDPRLQDEGRSDKAAG